MTSLRKAAKHLDKNMVIQNGQTPHAKLFVVLASYLSRY